MGCLVIEVFIRVEPAFIIVVSIPLCIMLALPLSLILSLINIKFGFVRSKLFKLLLPFPFVITLAILGWDLYSPSPEELFERYISREVPETVSDIRGTLEYPAIAHIARVTFRINKNEYDSLILKYGCKKINRPSPLSWPVINQHSWWNPEIIEKLPGYEHTTEKDLRCFWYDEASSICYFIHVDF